MVSRRKILSRSRDDLNLDHTFSPQEEEEDVWYQKEKLYKEHIQEVLDKWTQIDDEIWAKVIVFERNRRVAKAYARAPVLTINGSDDGFDGMRIGLCGFDNPMRDQKTEEYKRHIGQGVKIKMDDAGNILIRRYAKSNVYIKSTASSPNEETSIGADILKLPNQALENEKIVKLFDMKKFQSNVNRELRRAYPDRRRLETQCLSVVAFVRSENDILDCPIWVLIVNVVAMDMLKSKLPPVQRPMVDIKNRPRIPIPDEDPYSVAGNGSGGSSGSSGFGAGSNSGHQQQTVAGPSGMGGVALHGMNGVGTINGGVALAGHVVATREQMLMQAQQQLAHKRSEKPPKLPPRDNIYAHDIIPKPDYDDIEVDSRIKLARGKSDKGKDNKKYDDPYYCGLRARVPNFVKSSKSSKEHKERTTNGGNTVDGTISSNNKRTNSNGMNTLSQKKNSMIHMSMTAPNLQHGMHVAPPPPPHMHPHHIQQQQMMAAAAAHAVHHHHPAANHLTQHPMWQTRSYESGIGIYNSSNGISNLGSYQQRMNAAAASSTFSVDHPTNNNNNKSKSHQMSQAHESATTTKLPALAQSQSLAQAQSNEHAQKQQQQQLHNAPPQLLSAALPKRVMPVDAAVYGIDGHERLTYNNHQNYNNKTQFSVQLQQQQKQQQYHNLQIHERGLHHHHHHHQRQYQHTEQKSDHNHNHNSNHHHHRHHSRSCARRQMSFNISDIYEPLPAPPNSSNDYDYSNLDQNQAYITPTQSPLLNRRTSRSGFPRFSREQQQTLSPHRSQVSNSSQSYTSSAIVPDCNCVSCYTLAPLFGVAQPKRPPRSLSQQKLLLHQQLSGSLADIATPLPVPPPPPPPPLPPLRTGRRSKNDGVNKSADSVIANCDRVVQHKDFNAQPPHLMKWCSENDLSIFNPQQKRCLAASNSYTYNEESFAEGEAEADPDANGDIIDDDFYDGARNTECLYMEENRDAPRYTNDFDFDYNDYASYYAAPRRPQTRMTDANNKQKSYNEHAMQTRRFSNTTYLDDMVLDVPHINRYTNKLRQLQSPPPPLPPSEKCTNRDDFVNSPSPLRQKSLSIESFFEQPNEEGSLYMYGGRKYIAKAPSTTSLYDRLKGKNTNRNIVPSLSATEIRERDENNDNAHIRRLGENEVLQFQRHTLGVQVTKNNNSNSEPTSKATTVAKKLTLEEKPILPPPRWRGRKSFIENNIKFDINNNAINGSNKTIITKTMTTSTTTATSAAPSVIAASKLLSGSKVAATKAAFEKKMHDQKRLEQQEKLKEQTDRKQKQKQEKQQLKHKDHLNKSEAMTVAANALKDVSKAQRVAEEKHEIDNNKNNRNSSNNNNNNNKNLANRNLTSNNNKRDYNNNIVKKTNIIAADSANNETSLQAQQQQIRQGRLSRTSSRLDVSEMESIYGYLKPRKPRSLSLKKIQILDYD